MSSGYASANATIMSLDGIQEIIPVEFKGFLDTLSKNKTDFNEFCKINNWEGEPDWSETDLNDLEIVECQSAFALAQLAFAKATKVGDSCLTLHAGYHSASDEGDCYDEVDGGFFHVGGVKTYTEAGKKFLSLLEEVSYVTYG